MTTKKYIDSIDTLKDKHSHAFKRTNIRTYEYWAKVEKVIDGDTIELSVAVGFELTYKSRFRLFGINTPEIFGVKKDSDEYRAGVESSEYVKKKLPVGSWVEITVYSEKKEKYGRWLCEVYVKGKNLNEDLVDKGYAKVYNY